MKSISIRLCLKRYIKANYFAAKSEFLIIGTNNNIS